ncbi:MAG: hypothetical protein R3Y56_08775 [Akkermansia sp.]
MQYLRPFAILFFWGCCLATLPLFIYGNAFALLLPIMGLTPYLSGNMYEGIGWFITVGINAILCIAAFILYFCGMEYAILLPIIWIAAHWLAMAREL